MHFTLDGALLCIDDVIFIMPMLVVMMIVATVVNIALIAVKKNCI